MTIKIFLTYNLDYYYNAQVATAHSSNSATVMPELSPAEGAQGTFLTVTNP